MHAFSLYIFLMPLGLCCHDCEWRFQVIYDERRAASVCADKKTSLWVLDRFSFKDIMQATSVKKRKNYENCLKLIPLCELLMLLPNPDFLAISETLFLIF